MKSTTKMMTDSLIDVGQPSKKSATKVEAAFPSKNLSKKKSLFTLPSTKVEGVHSSKFKKEEAADFQEAINEKMKDLEVKKEVESVTAAAGDGTNDSVAFTSQSRTAGRFRAFVGGFGFDTGAKEIDKALRQHFGNCGGIELIEVISGVNDQARHAYINFTSLESLLKALQLKKTSFRGHPLTVYRVITNNSTFRAIICGLDVDTGARELDVLQALSVHFKICGEIEDIVVITRGYARIDFASLASLDKALELNNTVVWEHPVTVHRLVSYLGRFRAEIRGFDTGAGAEEVHKALRKHFEECGRIEGISVGAWYACIDFASLGSLFKALELNNTKVGDHRVTVRQPEDYFHTSAYRASIRWFDDIDLNTLRSYFEKCGGIAGIRYSCGCARIDFTNFHSLNKALELDHSFIGNREITVKKCILNFGASGRPQNRPRHRPGRSSRSGGP